jgi:predicted transcriptional regulator
MTGPGAEGKQDFVEQSANIVAAYVSHNSVSPADLPKLIAEVNSALQSLRSGSRPWAPVRREPAVSIRKSVTPEYLICLEDGKKLKSMKRYLRSVHHLSPEEYRQKWGLPPDYPMVAPNYSSIRSELAKTNGLGRREPISPTRKVVAG